jgi:hypothetical protein
MALVRVVLALVTASVFFTDASAQTTACVGSSEIACTEQGAVRGVAQGVTMAFKGLPYAALLLGRCGGSRLHHLHAGMACATAAGLEPCAHSLLQTR